MIASAASSHAFQAAGRSLEPEHVDWLNEFSTQGLKPDLYVLLDLSVEESLKRMRGRAQEADRFEREHRDFHEKVRARYLKLAELEPSRWLVLSAASTSAHLLRELWRELKERQWLD